MLAMIKDFILLLWDGMTQLEVCNLGFSFGALFVVMLLIDVSIFLVGRQMGMKSN